MSSRTGFKSTIDGATGFVFALVLLATAFTISNATAKEFIVGVAGDTIEVSVNKSRIINLPTVAENVLVGNKTIADIVIVKPTQMQVFGLAPGNTNMMFLDKRGSLIQALNVEVTHDLEALKEKLYRLLPGEQIMVSSSQGAIVLSGEVSSAVKMDAALALAKSFLPQGEGPKAKKIGEVLNLMQIGGSQQVMLEVQVAEISRQLTKRMGIKFNAINASSPWTIGSVNGGASFPEAIFDNVPIFHPVTGEFLELADDVKIPIFNSIPSGPNIQQFVPTPLSIQDKGIFATFLNNDFLFNMVLDAARDQGLAKILSEPTLTTLTGQEASFLAGGEFPIPVANEDGIVIEYKEYGVGLKFLPTVLDSGTINLKINISVSEISNTNSIAVGFENVSSAVYVPSLIKRSANASISLGSGQTMGIAGLINESLRESVDKFPVLGDMPVLGALYRSQEYIKGQTELVILVTPHFAQPAKRHQYSLPTDSFVEPDDVEFYLLGRIEKGQPADPRILEMGSGGGIEQPVGHDLKPGN